MWNKCTHDCNAVTFVINRMIELFYFRSVSKHYHLFQLIVVMAEPYQCDTNAVVITIAQSPATLSRPSTRWRNSFFFLFTIYKNPLCV